MKKVCDVAIKRIVQQIAKDGDAPEYIAMTNVKRSHRCLRHNRQASTRAGGLVQELIGSLVTPWQVRLHFLQVFAGVRDQFEQVGSESLLNLLNGTFLMFFRVDALSEPCAV